MMALSGANTGEFLGGQVHSKMPPTDELPLVVMVGSLGLSVSMLAGKRESCVEESGSS